MRPTGSDGLSGAAPESMLPDLLRYLGLYAPALLAEDLSASLLQTDGLFLTVIVRTTGHRSQLLRETLLCLSSQDTDDFEVVVVVHNPADEVAKSVLEDLRLAQVLLPDRVRLVTAHGGSRGEPVVEGLKQANGQYAVVLDDDDHVTADWVSTFKRLWLEAPGRVLRAGSSVRENTSLIGPDGGSARVATSAPVPLYCESWSLERHLESNGTPFHAFAFPVAAVRKLGLTIDAGLDLAEDWDLLLRMSGALGVHEDLHVTSIYNMGLPDSSVRSRRREDWAAAEGEVRRRHAGIPRLTTSTRVGHPALKDRLEAAGSAFRELRRSASYVAATEGISGVARRVPRRLGRLRLSPGWGDTTDLT